MRERAARVQGQRGQHREDDLLVELVHAGPLIIVQLVVVEDVDTGAIELREGAPEGVKSPTEVGTGKAGDEPARLSEIIQVLNSRFGTNFTEEDRLFFEQIREKATRSEQVVQLRQANPFDKFQLGLRQIVEALMIQRMTDNDKIVTRYMDDKEFGETAFAVLSKSIYDSIPSAVLGAPAR